MFHCNFAAPLCHVCAGVASELCVDVYVRACFMSHDSYWILFHSSFATPLCADVASKLCLCECVCACVCVCTRVCTSVCV